MSPFRPEFVCRPAQSNHTEVKNKIDINMVFSPAAPGVGGER
jgi:hypothetical protein